MANPFDVNEKTYHAFPNDEYVDVCLLSFQNAELPPGPMADNNEPVPSVRFLFGGYIKDEAGNWLVDEAGAPIVARKWTKWMRISSSERATMMNLFDTTKTGFVNLLDILRDYEKTDGKLWQTPFKILLEQNDKYQNIIRIKPGTNKNLVANVFYDDKYIPYKVIKAFGKLQELSFAACKFKSGVKLFEPEDMVMPDDSND